MCNAVLLKKPSMMRSCKWYPHASTMLTLTYSWCDQRCYRADDFKHYLNR